MTGSSRKESAKHIKKPISRTEYRLISDLCYSLILGQATAGTRAERPYWERPSGHCIEVAIFTAALLNQKPFKKRFRKVNVRQIEYLAQVTHPDIDPDSTHLFWAGNPGVFKERLPWAAHLLPELPGAFHVAVIAEDKRGHRWLIDPSGAAEAYHAALIGDAIPDSNPEGQYAQGVCPLNGGPPLLVARISDVSRRVKDYCYRPLTMDLAAAAMAWYRRPRTPMAAQDQYGAMSVIEWQDGAFWKNAPAEIPDNITQLLVEPNERN